MYKKIIITFLIIFIPIAFIEQEKNDTTFKLDNKKFVRMDFFEKNYQKSINQNLQVNKKNSIGIENCWKNGILLFQKQYCYEKNNQLDNI